jgi:hypothetical protein
MQGQRLQQEETLILGQQQMWSIKNKWETILQHLQKPPNLSFFNAEDHVLEDASVCDPVTPIKLLPPSLSTVGATSASSDWFKLSCFDPAKNLKGLVCKKAPPQKFLYRPFWNKYFYGSPGKMPP